MIQEVRFAKHIKIHVINIKVLTMIKTGFIMDHSMHNYM